LLFLELEDLQARKFFAVPGTGRFTSTQIFAVPGTGRFTSTQFFCCSWNWKIYKHANFHPAVYNGTSRFFASEHFINNIAINYYDL